LRLQRGRIRGLNYEPIENKESTIGNAHVV
jgi:hypothetical protein